MVVSTSNKTKNALSEALKDLTNKTPFAKISIGNICEKCNICRKSFYYHFKDKYDLVYWIFQTELVQKIQIRTYETSWDLLEDICIYLYDNRKFYVNVFQANGQNSFREIFSEILHPIISNKVESTITYRNHNKQQFYTQFITDAYLLSIERWLMAKIPMNPIEYINHFRMEKEELKASPILRGYKSLYY